MRHTLLIGQTNQSICPVNVMKHYFTRRGTTPGPLFIFASGRPLTKGALTAESRQLLSHFGFQASDYAGHSYRIGAATAAASAGLPPWLVKTLGRWSSHWFVMRDTSNARRQFYLGLLWSYFKTLVSYCFHCLCSNSCSFSRPPPHGWLKHWEGGHDCYERYIQCSQSIFSGVAWKVFQTQVSYCFNVYIVWLSKRCSFSDPPPMVG